MKRRGTVAVLLVALAGAVLVDPLPPESAAAQSQTTASTSSGSVTRSTTTPHQVMLLVDTSGSMNEDDGNKRVKIDGARQALIDFVRSVPPGSPVGLRTYPGGTDSENGCSKGSLRVGLNSSNLSTVDAEIRSLSADGDTPTSAALRQAAEDLKAAGDGSGTIVLVSDGESNCGPDPCDVAKQIVAGGIDVTVDTVGFRISQTGRTQLQCIAGATHGRYGDVGDNQQLIDELNRLAQPLVDVRLDYPSEAKAAVGQDASGTIKIVATLTAVGARGVLDAEADLDFAVDNAPAVLSPRRRLGNLPAGASTSVTWTFRPPLEQNSRPLDFTVTAAAANSPRIEAMGHIALIDDIKLEDAGPLLKGRKRVVILGDSYSAGEGGGEYAAGTDTEENSCHRSPHTYAMELFPADAKPDNFACSGAVTNDILRPNRQNKNEPAQVSHLERTPYDLALISIGGNDVHFPIIGLFCAVVPACQDYRIDNFSLLPSFGDLVLSTIDGFAPKEADTLRKVEEELNSSRNIRARSGPAPLVVMGYPAPVPLTAGLRYLSCSLAFDIGEMRFFQTVAERLNGAIATAVATLRREGRPVYFVPDVIDSFQPDHTYCSTTPWVHRVSSLNSVIGLTKDLLKLYVSNPFASPSPLALSRTLQMRLADDVLGALPIVRAWQEQMHPTQDGYRAMTKELERWSTSPEARLPVTRASRLNGGTAGDLVVLKQGPTPVIGSTLVLQPAGEVQVQMRGLMPGSTASLVLQSDPAVLDQAVSDDAGRTVLQSRVPAGTRIGKHQLVVYFTRADGTTATVTRPVKMKRPFLWWDRPLAIAGVLLLAASMLMLRRRPAMRHSLDPRADVGEGRVSADRL